MRLIFTFSLACLAMATIAQSTFVTQVQTGNGSVNFTKCVQLTDGSFVAIGTCPGGNSGSAILLVKMDGVGRIITSQVITLSADYYQAYDIIKTTDGGFVINGFLHKSSFVMKYKSDMTLEWQKQLGAGEDNNLYFRKLYQTKDGSYLLTGSAEMDGYKNKSVAIVKINASGDITWAKSYLTRNDEFLSGFIGSGITEDTDGDYAVLAVRSNVFSSVTDSTALFTITPDGEPLWAKDVHGSDMGTDGASISNSSSGVIITGSSYNTMDIGGTPYTILRMIMAKFDADGKQKWFKQVSSPAVLYNIANASTEDKGGNYIFGGTGTGFNATYTGIENFNYFISLNPDGSLAWTRKISTVTDHSTNLNLSLSTSTDDGGYIACGKEMLSATSSATVASLYKLDNQFQACSGTSDSDGEVIDGGTSSTVDIEADTIAVSAEDFTATSSDFGTFLYPCNSILPVQLLSFTANLSGSLVNVNWQTANEINADRFMVERSSNGIDFAPLQQVAAKGNSTSTELYSMKDNNPLAGTSYYRLKQTDKSGSVTYSSVVTILRSGNEAALVSPNPVQNTIHIILQKTIVGKVTLQVTDMTGKTVAVQSSTVAAGTNTIDIPATSLAKGMYLVKIVQNNAVQTLRIVKE